MEKIKKEDIVKELQKQLNFAPSEAEAYYYMLSEDQTAANLSSLLRINRSYVYGVLKKLIEKGFCSELMGTVRKFRALKPSLAFQSTIEDLNKKVSELNEFSSTLDTFYQERTESSIHDIVKVLHSKAHVLDTINKYEQEAKYEIISFSKPPYIMDVHNLDSASIPQRDSVSRGVSHKAIYELEKDSELFIKMVKFYKDHGEEVRIAEYLPMKLLIFDSQKVIFALGKKPGNKDEITFTFFNDENLAETFRVIFQTYWNSSLTYEEFIKKNK